MFQAGDLIKRKMSAEEAQQRADIDNVKGTLKALAQGRRLRRSCWHVGNAAAYLHTNQPYQVRAVTKTGGLRLEGFTLTVSQKDVEPATGDEQRGPGLRWGR